MASPCVTRARSLVQIQSPRLSEGRDVLVFSDASRAFPFPPANSVAGTYAALPRPRIPSRRRGRADDQLECRAQRGGNGGGARRAPVDEHVDHDAGGAGRRVPLPEKRHAVAHRARAEPVDPHAHLERLGVGDRREVLARARDDVPDDRAAVDVEPTLLDEVAVHDRVEVRVIVRVVHVPVEIVVHPARGHGLHVAVLRARGSARGRHGLYLIQTVFTFTKARMPSSPSSRPYPEHFTPPKGRRGSLFTMPFTNTAPASIRGTSRSISAALEVHSEAPRPKRESLAR